MIGRKSAAVLAGLVLASSSASVRADGTASRATSSAGVIDHRDGTVSSGSVSDASPHRDSIVVVPQTMSADLEDRRRQPAINIYVDPGSVAGAGQDASEGEGSDDRRPRRPRRRDR